MARQFCFENKLTFSGICWFLTNFLSNINSDGQHLKFLIIQKRATEKVLSFVCNNFSDHLAQKKVLVIEWYWAKQQQQIVIAKFSLVQVRKFQKAIVVSFNFQKKKLMKKFPKFLPIKMASGEMIRRSYDCLTLLSIFFV